MATATVTRSASGLTGRKRRPGRMASATIVRVIQYIFLLLLSAFVLLPFVWMVLSSLKKNNEIFTAPITWLPEQWQWHNYADIWAKSDMLTWLGNTVLLAVVVTFLQVLTGSFAAYGFSKIRFPGRDVLFIVYIGTISVPWQAYMIPQFKMLSAVGLSDTRLSIILLQAFGAFGVFLMKQFYDSIPEELSEAARIDGLSEYGIYRRIMLPLSVPSIASLAIITFTNTWNDYMGPLIYLRSPDLWTIQLGLKTFIGQYNADYAAIMTGSVLSVLPIALIFAFGQRYFVEGIATTGLKG
ncbi:carbohydrate ABC transporter permease [Actinomyces sp. MRS3W]|uniref:carbohydrate ABC transporter permease n=1 Tax=Actinomyces sp. MRS3W TaxID=2800796 RepID=UPI0028FD8A85|nr:carbohydrate ABC transporter permease [Actinomyces sp. MRS3W]MDU0348918.1 carbohydrate ABC transporter permease [Actinomyces sp. MRS3W]